jgi:hypothetical protein
LLREASFVVLGKSLREVNVDRIGVASSISHLAPTWAKNREFIIKERNHAQRDGVQLATHEGGAHYLCRVMPACYRRLQYE